MTGSVQPMEHHGPDSIRNAVALSGIAHWIFESVFLFRPLSKTPIGVDNCSQRAEELRHSMNLIQYYQLVPVLFQIWAWVIQSRPVTVQLQIEIEGGLLVGDLQSQGRFASLTELYRVWKLARSRYKCGPKHCHSGSS